MHKVKGKMSCKCNCEKGRNTIGKFCKQKEWNYSAVINRKLCRKERNQEENCKKVHHGKITEFLELWKTEEKADVKNKGKNQGSHQEHVNAGMVEIDDFLRGESKLRRLNKGMT